MKLKSVLLFFAFVPNICKADLTDLVSYDNTNKEQVKMYINEVYRRYPETREMKLEDNLDNEFLVTLIRSVLAEKVYEEYKSDFIKKFKAKSLSTGRKIMGYKSSSDVKYIDKKTGGTLYKQITTEIDFDKEIANLPDSNVMDEFHLYEDYLDKKECWYNGDAATASICDIPENSEGVSFSIAEKQGDRISKHVSFRDSDSKNNTSYSINVDLNGEGLSTLGKHKFVNMSLDYSKHSSTLLDRNNENRHIHYGIVHSKDSINTPYYEAAKNAKYYINLKGVNIKGQYYNKD